MAMTAIQQGQSIQSASGLRLFVANEGQPRLRIVLPNHPETDRSIEVIFPEHVTARQQGNVEANSLYSCWRRRGNGPSWRQIDCSWEYATDLNGILLRARATLEDDGVCFRYTFTNCSTKAYDMIYAVTDPRLTSMFHDAHLERTYVHHSDGFDLLASETPERLTMPTKQWLPCRYMAPFTCAVSPQHIEFGEGGITHYNKARPVDLPFIATLSTCRDWIVASFAPEVDKVWTNPELTCQHVDPQTSLALGQEKSLAMKILVLHGSLDQMLSKIKEQLPTLA